MNVEECSRRQHLGNQGSGFVTPLVGPGGNAYASRRRGGAGVSRAGRAAYVRHRRVGGGVVAGRRGWPAAHEGRGELLRREPRLEKRGSVPRWRGPEGR